LKQHTRKSPLRNLKKYNEKLQLYKLRFPIESTKLAEYFIMKITIAVVTYNHGPEEIQTLLDSLIKSIKHTQGSSHVFQLIYINNGNELNLNSDDIKIRKLQSEGNIGYTKACNLILQTAFEQLNQDIVITANPDGMFFYDTLSKTLNFIEKNPHTLIEISQFPEEHPKNYNPITNDVEWASGCCLVFVKSVVEKLGYLDEIFFMYMEDVDYSWRARLNDIPVKICPSAKFGHDVIDRPPPSKKVLEHFLQSGRHLGAKWGCDSFVHFCEDSLISEGVFTSKQEIPSLIDNIKYITNDKSIQVTNFNHHFRFAESRWG